MMENAKVNQLKDILINENPQFRELAQQHEHFEKRLSELAELTYPSDEEQIEENNLKRKKLAIKDEMYAILSTYESTH